MTIKIALSKNDNAKTLIGEMKGLMKGVAYIYVTIYCHNLSIPFWKIF